MEIARKIAPFLPEIIKPAGSHVLIYSKKVFNKNYVTVNWRSNEFRFGYWNRSTYTAAPHYIESGKIRHEGISLDHLVLPDDFDAAIDIGAHLGEYTVPLATINQNIPIYSFEPDPDNFSKLSKNIFINNYDSNRVRAHQALVSNANQTTTFYKDMSNTEPVSGTMQPVQNGANYESIECEMIDIAAFFSSNQIRQPWIKIDAEGEELVILERILQSETINSVAGFIELHLNREEISKDSFKSICTSYNLKIKEIKDTFQETNPGYLFTTLDNPYWE